MLTTSSTPSSMAALGISTSPPSSVPLLPTTTVRVRRRSGGWSSRVSVTRMRRPRMARNPEIT